MFHHIYGFLGQLRESVADLAVCELAKSIHELRAAGLEYQLGKAQGLRKRVLDSASAPEILDAGEGIDSSAPGSLPK